MNKTLIAMAVAGVMAAPMTAMADATVYGKIHESIDIGDTGLNNDDGANKTSGTFFQSNSGRVGVKGSEDLGGGLKAIWQFESNASFGSGSTSFGGRNSFLGLQGGWGTFLAGKHDTPYKDVGRWFDLFGDQVGDSRNLIQAVGGSNVGFDLRPDNVVAYVTPTFGGGFSIAAAYVLDDATDNRTATSINAKWKSGDFLVGLGYETHDQGWNGTNNSDLPVGTNDESGMRAGLQWSPGAWKLNLFYTAMSDLNGSSGYDSTVMGVGGAYTMGKNVIKAQYYTTSNDAPAPFDSDIDASIIAVGWDYKMSKRTTAYVAYSTTTNDANVYYCTDAGGHGGEVCGQAAQIEGAQSETGDPSVISFGMVHKF
jgi:predicted porin